LFADELLCCQENLTGIEMNIAQQRPGERERTFAIIAHHQVKARSTGPLVLLVLNPESEKFADSDGRLIASGLWQQQRLRKLANYRQEEPE
jgi:hypothetical protein